jgi:hypothetical protein
MTQPDWTLDVGGAPDTAVLRGVFRLESPEAYDRVFAPIAEALAVAGTTYTVDLSGVVLMNSSGIRCLADLVLRARRSGVTLAFQGRASIPWQHKTMASLRSLYDGLVIQLS